MFYSILLVQSSIVVQIIYVKSRHFCFFRIKIKCYKKFDTCTMAANGSMRNIFYAPTMFSLAKHLRIGNRAMATVSTTKHISKTSLSCLWNQDPSLPLPGNVGIDLNAYNDPKTIDKNPVSPYQSLASVLMDTENEDIRKQHVLKQFINEKMEEDVPDENFHNFLSMDNVECKIQSCPQSLIKGLKSLFEQCPTDHLTVITISQKTENDMTTWSEDVEKERETLISSFIENAQDICEKIRSNGYWADFIEPASGHAYYSEHRNETLFETDDRMNQLGFTVDDLGCCKVLLHKEWKSNVFVGLIFTDAPVESHFFESM